MAATRLTSVTSKNLKALLPSFLHRLGKRQEERPDLIIAVWPSLIGERLAPMTRAVSFEGGVLTVKVKNSSLLSLLTQHERPRLLKQLRKKFPNVTIRNIRFCIG
ncbi:MAG: hypothetical protein KR126chlam1_01082 [Chlamydiae bacterium]|nr:hypothetical protein [Chlamydiota bacterium]